MGDGSANFIGPRTGVLNMAVPMSTIYIHSLRVSPLSTDMSGTRVLMIDRESHTKASTLHKEQ